MQITDNGLLFSCSQDNIVIKAARPSARLQFARDCIETRQYDLVIAIAVAGPSTISGKLVQAGLIPDDTMDLVTDLSNYDQASHIISAVFSSIKDDPERITKLIKVLCESDAPGCQTIGKQMGMLGVYLCIIWM